MFPEGGTPRVIALGGPSAYPIRRVAHVAYLDDAATGRRWVEMDQAFMNDFVPALAQQGVQVEWVNLGPSGNLLECSQLVLALAQTLNLDPGETLTTAVLRAALTRLQGDA